MIPNATTKEAEVSTTYDDLGADPPADIAKRVKAMVAAKNTLGKTTWTGAGMRGGGLQDPRRHCLRRNAPEPVLRGHWIRPKQKEREQLEKNIANSERQLADEVFLGKAPPKVVDSIRAKLADYKAQLDKLS